MPVLQIQKQRHICELQTEDECVLPKMPPQVGRFHKWLHQLRRHFIVSGDNMRTEFVYRSSFTLRAEKRRQIRKYPWFIIHPFSAFYFYNEIIMAIVWAFALIKDPLAAAFLDYKIDFKNEPGQILDLLFDIMQLCHVGISFITGYYKYKTKEVVLNHKSIIFQYLKTYFVFDFIGSLPMAFIYSTIVKQDDRVDMVSVYLSLFRLLRLVRIKSMLHYSRQITLFIGISDSNHIMLMMLLIAVYIVHWGACALVLWPRIYYYMYKRMNFKSWLNYAPKQVFEKKSLKYLMSFNIFMCHFVSSGPGEFKFEDSVERGILIIGCLSGLFYIAIALTIILSNVSTRGSSESKYEELLHQLTEYCKRKRIPLLLRTQLKLYYEHRFQRHFFKEQEIMEYINPHMRYQITLHSCKYLLERVKLFSGLSKRVLGTIIASLQYEVYLPSDTIMKADEFAGCIYFIAYGTVAAYNRDGAELLHITDGDLFGAILLLYPNQNIVQSCVAVETTEVYRLDKEDFIYCMSNFEDFSKKIHQTLVKDIEYMEHIDKQLTESRVRKADILFDLRRGKILERNKSRKKEVLPI